MIAPRVIKAEPLRLHAASVCFDNAGVLLYGESGSGKSDLALRLIAAGATLIADDVTELRKNIQTGEITLHPEKNTAGMIELRGFGIYHMAYRENIPLVAVYYLAPSGDRANNSARQSCASVVTFIERNYNVPTIDPFEASITAKIKFSLTAREVL